MYVVDVKKIKGKMAELGFTQCSFAAALGISRETLRNYLNDYNKLTFEIMLKMIDVLKLTPKEARTIFFVLQLS